MVVGKALDVIGNSIVQLLVFYHFNTGGFLLFPLERGKCDTVAPRATPSTIGNLEKQYIQPIRNKKR
jgi:hypothetical protein